MVIYINRQEIISNERKKRYSSFTGKMKERNYFQRKKENEQQQYRKQRDERLFLMKERKGTAAAQTCSINRYIKFWYNS